MQSKQKLEVISEKLTPQDLHQCCAEGDFEKVFHIVENFNCDLEFKDKEGMTPLLKACEANSLLIVEILIQKGANPKALDNQNRNSLHFACFYGNTELVSLLCESKVEINQKDTKGRSPFSYAVEGDHYRCMSILIEHGLNVYSKLYNALKRGNNKLAKSLLKAINQNNVLHKQNSNLLHLVLSNKKPDIELLNLLIANGCDVNKKDSKHLRPLYYALKNQDNDAIMLLLKNGSVVDSKTWELFSNIDWNLPKETTLNLEQVRENTTKLFEFSKTKDCDLQKVKEVINNGGRLKFYKNTLSILCCQSNNAKFLDLVLSKYSASDPNKQSLLKTACINKANDAVSVLLKHGADLYRKSDCILHIACEYGNFEIVKKMVANGADILAEDTGGKTPLFYNFKSSNVKQTEFLLKRLPQTHINFFYDLKNSLAPNKSKFKQVSNNSYKVKYKKRYKKNRRNRQNLLIDLNFQEETIQPIAVNNNQIQFDNKPNEEPNPTIKILDSVINNFKEIFKSKKLTEHQIEMLYGIEMHNKYGSLLHCAIKSSNLHAVKLLLEKYHFDPNLYAENGGKPLHITISQTKDNFEIVKLLLTHGANPSVLCKTNQKLFACFEKAQNKVGELLRETHQSNKKFIICLKNKKDCKILEIESLYNKASSTVTCVYSIRLPNKKKNTKFKISSIAMVILNDKIEKKGFMIKELMEHGHMIQQPKILIMPQCMNYMIKNWKMPDNLKNGLPQISNYMHSIILEKLNDLLFFKLFPKNLTLGQDTREKVMVYLCIQKYENNYYVPKVLNMKILYEFLCAEVVDIAHSL